MNAQPQAKLCAAMAEAFAEIEGATKDKANPHFKSKYADLSSVIDAVKPALIKQKLFFMQHSHPSDGGVSVETFLHHASGESLSLGTLYVPANKNDPQGFGSALTYARRYALMTAFGVPAEDDDGNAASKATSTSAMKGDGQASLITERQRDLIVTLAPAAGRDMGSICEAYRVQSIKELTEAQAIKLIERLSQPIAEAA